MAIEYHETVRAGGGRLEYVAFVSGGVWGAATSQDLVNLLSADTTRRRQMFGGVSSAGTRPADTVPIFNVLQYPGKQVLKLDKKQGMLAGGDWEIALLREPLGYTWTHRTGTIWGLEGVHTLPDPRFDTSIGSARLSRTFSMGDVFLYLKEDIGDKIFDKVDAAANYVLIWVANECVLATVAADIGGGEIRLTVIRGALRSKEQATYIEDFDGTNVRVCDAPIGGVAGKPVCLWGYTISDDGGSILNGPVKIRHGRCTTNISSKGGATRVKCLGWHDQLDSTMKSKSLLSTMDKYVLSRPPASVSSDIHDCCGHLVVREGAADINQVWFCDEGDRVVFDTYEDLVYAVNYELGQCLNGTPNFGNPTLNAGIWSYVINNQGFTVEGSGTNEPVGLIAGPLPWLLGWGGWHFDSAGEIVGFLSKRHFAHFASYHTTQNGAALTNPQIAESAFASNWLSPYNDEGGVMDGYHASPGAKWRSPYLLQYDWGNEQGAAYQEGLVGAEPHMYSFPIPLDEDDGNKPKVNIKDDQDATSYDSTVELRIGQEGRTFDGRPGLFKMKLAATGDNYLQGDSPYEFEAFDNVAASIWTVDELAAPLTKGFIFYYQRLMDDKEAFSEGATGDPWPVSQLMEFTTTEPVKLLKALLGDTTDITLPENFTWNHIPDALDKVVDGYYDQASSADFDALEVLLHSLFDGHVYKIIVGPETTYMELLENLLLFHGISPAWDYRADVGQGQHVMGWRPLGVANATEAANAGRTIDANNRVGNDTPTEVHSLTNEYSKVVAKCNHTGRKFNATINTEDKTGYAITGGKPATLDIKDRISFIEGAEEIETNSILNTQIKQHFSSGILAKLALPAPTIKCKLNASSWIDIALGRECLITDPTAHNLFNGELGLVDAPAICTSFGMDLGKTDAICQATIQLTPNAIYGYAPAMIVDGGNSVRDVVGVNGETTITPTLGQLNDPAGPEELFFFDCYVYNPSTQETSAKSCSCTDYSVYAFLEDQTTAPQLPFRVSAVDLTAGTAVLLGDNTGWDTTKAYVIKFAAFDDGDLQSCQRNYLVYADADNEINDGADDLPGREWA